MAAQPPGRSRVEEIDLHDIIPAPEIETRSASEFVSSDGDELVPKADSASNKLFQIHDSLRIGWSGWTNVLFAAFMVLGGILCTVHFFDSPELRRWAQAHEREYLYPRPAEVASQELGGDRTSARIYSSNAATGQKDSGVSGDRPSGSNSQTPQIPPRSPQLPNSPANSARSDTASRGNSSDGAESRNRSAVASRARQARNVRSPRNAHHGMKSVSRTPHGSMHGPPKFAHRSLTIRNHSNQLSGMRSSALAMNKAGGGAMSSARATPNAMKSGAAVLRGSALSFAGLGREGAREMVRRERGGMNRR